ncbi:Germination-specific N-acetylmuramoyl-L-alanine amidase, partial [Frankliniella fusca]
MTKKVSRDRKLIRKKGKKKAAKPKISPPTPSPPPLDDEPGLPNHKEISKDVVDNGTVHSERQDCPTEDLLQSIASDHDYVDHDEASTVNETYDNYVPPLEVKSLEEIYSEVKTKVDQFLFRRWVSSVDGNVFRLVYLSAQSNVSVQRSLEFLPDGKVTLYVHCKELSVDLYLEGIMPAIPLECDTVNFFVDRVVSVINNVRKMEICSGYDEDKYHAVWASCPFGEVDKNPYRECRYSETFRSHNCSILISSRRWRCTECTKLAPALRRRKLAADMESPHSFTNNRFLTEEQKMKKLEDQRREIENTRRKVSRLHVKMQQMIKKNGILIEQSVCDDLQNILQDSDKLTPAQSVFLQQQIKASQQKNSCGMRWHPTMIRLALAIHLTSPSAYELMRDTGMVKLPSSRTLFDYSHANEIKERIDCIAISRAAGTVEKLTSELDSSTGECTYKKYHVLMADEMHISQNL